VEASTLEQVRAIDEEDPNIVWFAEECLNNHVPFEALLRQAELIRDHEMAAFFRRAQEVSRRLTTSSSTHRQGVSRTWTSSFARRGRSAHSAPCSLARSR